MGGQEGHLITYVCSYNLERTGNTAVALLLLLPNNTHIDAVSYISIPKIVLI